MLTWLLVNLALGLLAVVFIKLNPTAPHRLRFLAGFAALAAWLLPWPLVPSVLPATAVGAELQRIEHAIAVPGTPLAAVLPAATTGTVAAGIPPFAMLTAAETAFFAVTLIGCALFAWKLLTHALLLRRLEREGEDGSWLWARAGIAPVCRVGVQREIAGAFCSGLVKPCIWVHAGLVQSPQLATLLRHELTHIRQHDNWYLLGITLVERLFWWNPLVLYLGRCTRELQELSCDETCLRADAAYPAQLAQLMLDSARSGMQPRTLVLGANLIDAPNPNLKRIQLLQRSYPMLKRHILGAALAGAAGFLTVGFVTAQPDAPLVREPAQAPALERINDGVGDLLFGRPLRSDPRGDWFVWKADGESVISFRITDRPLPEVLMPLVNRINMRNSRAVVGVAKVRGLDESVEAAAELSTRELIASVAAAGGAANWAEARRVVSFRPRFVAGDKLVLAYPAAATRSLSLTADNLTIAAAIDAVAAASGCNIFQHEDTIVVDHCEE